MLASTSGDYASGGEEMVRGTQMYLDEVNRAGGIHGKPVELLVFDDEGDIEVGRQQAQKIAADDRILLALGPYFSSIALEAGKIYDSVNLPAVTATAQADEVTENNHGFFRVLFNTSKEGVLLANYVKKILDRETVTIIFDGSDTWSSSLATSFKNTFRGLEGRLNYQWDIHPSSEATENLSDRIDQILSEISEIDPESIGTIALFTKTTDAAKILIQLRRSGVDSPIIGGDSIAEQTFLTELQHYPEAQAQPGYFSDGIYATSPLIYDISNEAVQEFRNQFIEKYQQNPTWIAALSYDGAKVAIEAIKRANASGDRKQVLQERKAIRQMLSDTNAADKGVTGLNGSQLYFDRQRNIPRPIAMGLFDRQNFISAPIQLQPIRNWQSLPNLEEQVERGDIVRISGEYSYLTHVVYTGMDINEISNLDLKRETYIVDLFLWFRYQGSPELEKVEFLNSVEPIELDEPIYESYRDRLTTRSYRIKTQFDGNFDFRDYPFDTQELTIKFRHANLTRNHVIYVPDLVGMKNPDRKEIIRKFRRSEVFASIDNWGLKDARFFENIANDYSTLGNIDMVDLDSGIDYSQFNTVIQIDRSSLSFSINNLLPLACFLWILYIFLFFPFAKFSAESVSGILLSVVFFHIGLKSELPEGIGYIVALDVIFYVIYGLIATQVVLVLTVVKFQDNKNRRRNLKQLVRGFRVIFPLYLLAASFTVGWYYDIISPDNWLYALRTTPEPNVQATIEQATQTEEEVTLLNFATWKVEYDRDLKDLFDRFYEQHPQVEIQHLSAPYSNYGTALTNQFKKGVAPDVMFLRPYTLDRELFYRGDLADLSDFPNLQNAYSPTSLDPWTTEDGQIYGLPLSAVVHGIFYNIDLFEQLNLEVPQTWEDLLETAQILKNFGIPPFSNSFGNAAFDLDDRIFTALVPNFTGGREGRLAYEGGDRCFNDEGVVATFEAIAELQPYLDPTNRPLFESVNRFINGEAAMLISGSWELKDFEAADAPFEWSVFAVPPPAGQPGYTIVHPDFAVGLNAHSPHLEEAKDFLQWLMTPEAADFITNRLAGNFALHRAKPEVRNPHAQAFLALSRDRETDVR
ncbi:extracellular solute-binding protein [Baaleninema sp.]|uniref:extracellular solute-binding protein n=1 Tax=Baaleninema sp. TaxID=3101197 RepID=UPI003D023CA5